MSTLYFFVGAVWVVVCLSISIYYFMVLFGYVNQYKPVDRNVLKNNMYGRHQHLKGYFKGE